MPEFMKEEDRKRLCRATFNLAAEGYDCPALRFFRTAADLLPGVFVFQGNETVLDAATGTGIPAIAMAAHLPCGLVTGVDISEGMLARGEAKCRQAGIANIAFRQMDMTALDFPDHTFDAANCSFSLCFEENMAAALRHVASKVKPGGAVVTTNLRVGSLSRLMQLMTSQARKFGLPISPPGWLRLGTAELNAALFATAGLTGATVSNHDLGYFLEDTGQYWDVVWNSGFRSLLAPLDRNRLASFRQQFLEEAGILFAAGGMRLEVEVLITKGFAAREAGEYRGTTS